ncbi:MAG: TfoX/Sxy family protein [Planctomycetota bacterium]|nr:TfoX/Sxy family protein [Planctomycetota bacterium]
MAFDDNLAQRVRSILAARSKYVEKRMFGGIGFLLNNHMCVGIWKGALIARIGPSAYEAALRQPHVREFDITGRPMKGWILVEPDGVESDAGLSEWMDAAVQFVIALPPK